MILFIPIGKEWQLAADQLIDEYFNRPYQERMPVKLITPCPDHPAIDYLRDHGLTVIPFNPFTNAPYSDA